MVSNNNLHPYISGARFLADVDELECNASCTLLLALSGGKGGFGSLLRGAAKSARVTTNFDACRDLSGRRLRHVNGEKKIQEFQTHQVRRRRLLNTSGSPPALMKALGINCLKVCPF